MLTVYENVYEYVHVYVGRGRHQERVNKPAYTGVHVHVLVLLHVHGQA